MQAWLEGLRERGYVVGRNLQIEYRYSQAQTDRIPALVAELVALGPEVIVSGGPYNTVGVHAAAPTVPLVFLSVAGPVALGLVESLAHPGGNVTGLATVVPEGFTGKQLQLLKELVPRASRIAVLLNPENPMTQRFIRPDLPEIGRQVGVALVVVEASQPEQLETAFETAHTQGAEAIHVLGDPLTNRLSAKVVGLAARYRLPAMYLFRPSVVDGGLISYGPDLDFWRRAGTYVDKILKGERPGDLPVEQPTRFHLIVNLKTAAELGITVPPSILAQADEVIE
jgi:putative ABC transport system substrate-binding protein